MVFNLKNLLEAPPYNTPANLNKVGSGVFGMVSPETISAMILDYFTNVSHLL